MRDNNFIKIKENIIYKFIYEILTKVGLNENCSHFTTEGLLEASLRGVDSHGIRLLPHYVNAIDSGRINKKPKYTLKKVSDTTAILNANHSIGFSSGIRAIEEVIKMAKEHGMGGVSVTHSTHGGMLAYYTLKAARKGLFALAVSNTTPRLIPPGGIKPFLGTNPICYAFPLLDEEPLCFDSATTQITGNKVKMYRKMNQQLPDGVAADKEGNTVTDPEKAEYLYAFGGYKGFGLAMLVDILCGALGGIPNSEYVSEMYGSDISEKRYLGQFFMVFDISCFRPITEFTRDLQEEVNRLRSLPNTGNTTVIAPGDPEKNEQKKRLKEGIPVDSTLLHQLNLLAKEYSVPFLRN